ncbi:MAG: sialate O-acetylesterase [Opitutaceae bacterium]|jgi:sialate O-acetylesterase
MKPHVPPFLCASLLAVSLFSIALPLSATVTLAPLFRDGAVLQQGRAVPVWGQADAGEKVRVSFGTQSLETKSNAQGHWMVKLAPLAINATPAELVVTGTNTLRVSDVLVGEVWLCSGQSNMAWTFKTLKIDPPAAPAVNDPLLRHFKIPNVCSPTPLDTMPGDWQAVSETNAADISAVAYFFGRELRTRLKVPVGLINSSWGGSQIESWMSASAIAANPVGDKVINSWKQILSDYPAALKAHETQLAKWNAEKAAASAAGQPFKKRQPRAPIGEDSNRQPSSIYNAMINPIIPAAFRGVIWYQGETNAARFDEYRELFPAMITQWRSDFEQPELPFYFVQLANLERTADTSGRQWAFQREAQTAALKLSATGMAVTIDIGDPANIHPKNKHDVGQRLAALALTQVYQLKTPANGPRFARIESANHALRVHFTHADGLIAGSSGVTGFEIAGVDQIFQEAEARIDGTTVIVSSSKVPSPVAVRYAFKNNPAASLHNADGLPAEPFRSDKW